MMWDEEAIKLVKKRGKGSLNENVRIAIKMTPEKVKFAVIEKWLRY